MSELRILRTDDLPSNGTCSCKGAVTWQHTENGPRANASSLHGCTCEPTKTADAAPWNADSLPALSYSTSVEDARDAMIARRGDRFRAKPADVKAASTQADASEDVIERAKREAAERRANRFRT